MAQASQRKRSADPTRAQQRWQTPPRSELDDRAPFGCRGRCNKLVQFFRRHAGELSFLVYLKNMDAVFHGHFEERHCEPRNLVCDAHARILPVNHRCCGDTRCVEKVGSDELISRLPEGEPKVSQSGARRTSWLGEQASQRTCALQVDYLK